MAQPGSGRPPLSSAPALKAKSEDPDFWSVVGETELDQYDALAQKRLASAHKKLNRAYQDLHKRVTADADVGLGLRYCVSRVAELRQSHDRQGKGGRQRSPRSIADVCPPGGGSVDGERDCEWSACGHDPRCREHDDGPRPRVDRPRRALVVQSPLLAGDALGARRGGDDEVSRSEIPRATRCRVCESVFRRRGEGRRQSARGAGGLAAAVRMPRPVAASSRSNSRWPA